MAKFRHGHFIYRRYRRCKWTGRILDAHDYGLKAWKMWVPF